MPALALRGSRILHAGLLLATMIALAAPTGSAGVYVNGVRNTDVPVNVTVSRASGSYNEISWTAPTSTNGYTLHNYIIYRYPSDAFYSPVQTFKPAATATSWTDSWAYPKQAVYYLSAMFKDSDGTSTESLLIGPIFAGPSYTCVTYQVDSNGDLPVVWSFAHESGCPV